MKFEILASPRQIYDIEFTLYIKGVGLCCALCGFPIPINECEGAYQRHLRDLHSDWIDALYAKMDIQYVSKVKKLPTRIVQQSNESHFVAIPATICDLLDIQKGDKLRFNLDGNKIIVYKEK
jgi:hypothetical protein